VRRGAVGSDDVAQRDDVGREVGMEIERDRNQGAGADQVAHGAQDRGFAVPDMLDLHCAVQVQEHAVQRQGRA